MKLKNSLTPYPVLSSGDDYLNVSFNVELSSNPTTDGVFIAIKFDLNDEALLKLVEEGKAQYAVHVECPYTYWRKFKTSHQNVIVFEVNSDDVSGDVEVCTFLVATQDIKGFSSPNFHSDYAGHTFDIFKGGILASSDSFKMDMTNDVTGENTESIIAITEGEKNQAIDISVNTDGSDKIYVSLKPELYALYERLAAGKYEDIIFSLILNPVLQTVLERISTTPDSYNDARWYKTIIKSLNKLGVKPEELNFSSDKKSIHYLVQKIFENPTSRAFDNLERLGVDYVES